MDEQSLIYRFEKGIMTDKERQRFIDDYISDEIYAQYLIHSAEFTGDLK